MLLGHSLPVTKIRKTDKKMGNQAVVLLIPLDCPLFFILITHQNCQLSIDYSHSSMNASISSACASRLWSSLNWALVRIRLCFGLCIL